MIKACKATSRVRCYFNRRTHLAKTSTVNLVRIATLRALCMLISGAVGGQARPGITHTLLLERELPDSQGQEVIVWDTEYEPGAISPRHLHPAAITFHVLSGTGVWQEDGKPPITLHAGDSLFVAAGTIHSHWNPSATEQLRFLEFIVAAKGEGRSIPQPLKN
jgi:quercetin dioxygenase-like cupin family protein